MIRDFKKLRPRHRWAFFHVASVQTEYIEWGSPCTRKFIVNALRHHIRDDEHAVLVCIAMLERLELIPKD